MLQYTSIAKTFNAYTCTSSFTCSLSYFPLVCLREKSGAGQLSVQSCYSPIASASTAAHRLHRSASTGAPCLRPLQLLLAACVHFSCCSPIASASTAPQLRPLQLPPDCIGFNCCSPIASACSPSCSGRFQLMPNALEHSSRSSRFKYEGHESLVKSSPTPPPPPPPPNIPLPSHTHVKIIDSRCSLRMFDAVLLGLCFRPWISLPATFLFDVHSFRRIGDTAAISSIAAETPPTNQKLLELAHPSKGLDDY